MLPTPIPASATVSAADHKPFLRGWSHAAASAGAGAATLALCLRCLDDPPRIASMLVYGVSMCALFAVSAVYHLGSWPPALRARLRGLDHASIFGLIAGTFTPIAFNVLGSWERVGILVAIWAQAAIGVASTVITLPRSRWTRTALYLAMGWTAALAAPSLLRALPPSAIAMLLAGGLAYSAGALVYALRRPNPFPRVFGFHEVFHVFVIAGTSAFVAAIWVWVVPFPRS